ncbi:targeting protein for Xklp2 homolog isoform X2 [Ceratitis capitata]|uniref:targeting protein for Xklp2 homolog isoform X2 n=1 Tax=Ceratitis capitata TaxID=7213 RepID=UPI000329D638|nr:targeting protein for Xklp2 homolog isoform X2 [Ceratitis capitata]
MSYLMPNDFNWDDIDVGNHVLDHSQKFFQQKHNTHERLDESKEMDLIKEIDAISLDDTFESSQNKENIDVCSKATETNSPLKELSITALNDGNKTNLQSPKNEPKINPGFHNTKNCDDSSVRAPLSEQQTNATNALESLIARNKARINPSVNKCKTDPESNIDDAHTKAANPTVFSESLIKRNKARINPGVKKENIIKPNASPTTSGNAVSKGAVPKQPASVAPHAYHCSELYKRRKEEQLQKRLEEERKMREFHSRPVPNFTACHKSLQDKKLLHVVTVAVTPQVLKKSRESEEKRKQKLDQIKQVLPPKFEPRPPNILHEKPFIPKKTQTVLVSCPFKLNSERRLQERKQYDATVQRAMEEKQKQEEEERKRREELRIKELRKLTKFKARPNPFK